MMEKQEITDHLSPSFNFAAVWALLRIEKQYGTFLVLLPALWALFIASEGRPDPILAIVIIGGAFLMRSAGCAINDIADRNFDPHVDRTKGRPLASGRMSLSHAIIVFLLTVLLALFLAFYLNRLAFILSPFCLFFVILYPFTKRFISVPQLFLGIAFGWGSIIVWAAVKARLEPTAFLIFFSTVTWALAYDTVYAMMDIDDDLKLGVRSAAIFFGDYVREAVALFFSLTVALLVAIGFLSELGSTFYVSLILASIIFLRQVTQTGKAMDRETAFSAFKSNVLAGFIILMGIILNYVL